MNLGRPGPESLSLDTTTCVRPTGSGSNGRPWAGEALGREGAAPEDPRPFSPTTHPLRTPCAPDAQIPWRTLHSLASHQDFLQGPRISEGCTAGQELHPARPGEHGARSWVPWVTWLNMVTLISFSVSHDPLLRVGEGAAPTSPSQVLQGDTSDAQAL